MDNRKLIVLFSFLLKTIFLIGSWVMFILSENEVISYKINVLWRDINEYTLYVLVPLTIFEIIKLKIRPIIFSALCIITSFLLTQSITADGTRLNIWLATW
jgi:hypothetical protein